jgi:hypothetical protein
MGRLRAVSWDFGILGPGRQASHRFEITNNSTGTWTVKRVNRSCTCTVGEFSRRQVKPSETTALEIAFKTGSKEGPVYQAVMIEFEEPKSPLVQLIIKGEIRNPLSASPASVELGRVAVGQRARQTIELGNYSDKDLSIAKVEAPEGLQTDLEPLVVKAEKNRPRQAWKLVVHLDSGKLKRGPGTGLLAVHTNSEAIGVVNVPVRWHVNRPLEAIPDRLAFGTVESGENAEKAILLEVAPELGNLTDKDLLPAHNLGAELDVRISRTATPRRFKLDGRFRPTRAPAPVAGELEITVRGQSLAPLRIKITGEVR